MLERLKNANSNAMEKSNGIPGDVILEGKGASISLCASRAQTIIKCFGKIRSQYGLDFDDIAIFLACGSINFCSRKFIPFTVQPASASSIADYVEISRETVRRRLIILEKKELIVRVVHGYIVVDIASWSALIENIS